MFLLLSCTSGESDVTKASQTCQLRSVKITQDALFSFTTYRYGSTGLLLEQIDSSNVSGKGFGAAYSLKRIQFFYDKSDLLTQRETSLSSYSKDNKVVDGPARKFEEFRYNQAGQVISNQHFGYGNLLAEPNHTDIYEYANGIISKISLFASSVNKVITFRSGIPITVVDRKLESELSPGTETSYVLNDKGYITSSKHTDGIGRIWITTQTYDPQGRSVLSVTQVDQETSSYRLEYDNQPRPETLLPALKGFPVYNLYGTKVNNVIKTSTDNQPSSVLNTSHTYNADGYPLQSQVTGPSITTPITYVYSYQSCQ